MAKILIVDDEIQLIQMVQMRLEASGYEVVTANDGVEGLKKVKSENPDLIILDIMMPKMDGFEACDLLKKDPQTSQIPIIFLTGIAQQDDLDRAREAGADAYIKKPFETPDLLAKIEELLHKPT